MPLGILSDEEFESEISKSKNGNGKLSDNNGQQETNARFDFLKRGRGPVEEKPESARKLIGEMAIQGEPAKVIEREFGISASSISAYKNGATSTASYNQPDENLKKHTDGVRDKIVKRAKKKLFMALDGINEDKLADCDAKGLSSVAKDMSTVIRNMEPEVSEKNNIHGNFIFLVPPMRKETDYPIIDVTE